MIYDHLCANCGPICLDASMSDYLELTEEFGEDEKGNPLIPCPECDQLCPRDFSNHLPAAIVKGGYKYTYNKNYRAGAEEEWLRNEVSNSRRINKRGGSGDKRPYSNYYIKDPEAAGFTRVDESTAKSRAEQHKSISSPHQQTVDQARKR